MQRIWPLVLVAPLVVSCGSSGEPGGSGGGGGGSGGSGGAPISGSGGGTNASTGGGATGSGGAASTSATTSGGTTTSGTTSGGTTTSGTTSSASSSSASSSSASSGGGMGVPCSNSLPTYDNGKGSVTYYTLDMGSQAVNCSFDILAHNPDTVAHVATGAGHDFAAMNTADYNNAATCGACVEVTRDGNKKVIVTVVDQCPSGGNPKCKPGHLDLSQAAFLKIGTQQEGYLGTGNGGAVGSISWHYVDCPTSENVTYRLKEPGNLNWNQILVEGHRYPIVKVEAQVNGQWIAGTRQSYNYWQIGNGNLGSAPYHVRVTDVNGAIVEAQLALAAGDQASAEQFHVCQ